MEEGLVLWSEPVDSRKPDRLYGPWHLDHVDVGQQAIGPALTDQQARLHQRPHALLQEKRISLGTSDQELLQRPEALVITEQRPQKFLGTLRRQRIDPQLGVPALAGPA